MKSSATVLEPRLAWALWQGLEKLSDLLWERYEAEFLDLAEEEGAPRAEEAEEDAERRGAQDLGGAGPRSAGLDGHGRRGAAFSRPS